MSSYSSTTSSSSTSSSTKHSPRTHAISIGFTPGGSDALLDIFPQASSTFHQSSATAFPSWPKHESLYSPPDRHSASSYISDEDLFGLEEDSSELPYLSEAPAPPREAHQWLMPAPQPMPQLALPKPKVHFKKSPKKTSTSRRASKALPVIRETTL
ncbi:Glucoamylase [Sphaceloma murrayae]|uniref:Glucoamylase n=1 Tax=Sphaceloma murrayae TaxID=2082308 RepID=A0A2K1QTR6_9PEZI|nr:Glucoamylase [Sphaceloma murrayae]